LVNRVIFASVILHLIAPNSQTANHRRHTPACICTQNRY